MKIDLNIKQPALTPSPQLCQYVGHNFIPKKTFEGGGLVEVQEVYCSKCGYAFTLQVAQFRMNVAPRY